MSTPVLRLTPRSVVRAVLIVAVTLLVAGMAVRAAHPLVWFLNASVIAAVSWPAIQHLRRHLPAWAAVLLLTVSVLGVLAGLAVAGFTELQQEAAKFERSVPAAAKRLEDESPLGGTLADIGLADQTAELARRTSDRFDLGKDLPGLASRAGGAVSTGFLVWILAVMLVFTGPKMVDAAVGTLAPAHRARVGPALHTAYGRVLRYLGLTSLRCLAVGVVVFVLAEMLGVDLPAMLAVIAAVTAFVPYIGIVAGMLPLALLSVLDGSVRSYLILGLAVALQLVDSLVVQRRIHARSFRFGMLLTLVSAVVGFSLHGTIGLLVGLFVGAMAVALLEALGTPDEDPAAAGDTSEPSTDAGGLSAGPTPAAAT